MKSIRSLVLWLLTLSFSNATAFSPLFSSVGSGPSPCSSLYKSFNYRTAALSIRGGDDQENEQPLATNTVDDANSEGIRSSQVAIPGIAAMGNLLTTAGRSYTQQLDKFPIFTKSYTAGIIFALSDYIAQKVENGDTKSNDTNDSKKKTLDKTRLLASTLVGFLYFGPAAHYWYEMIFALLPGTSLWSTLQKAILGQAIFGPSFTCVFFAVSLLQSGQFSLGAWGKKIKSDLPGAWLAGTGFWPLVDFISYSIVPVKWIPLFINMCSLVWTVYLSIVANRTNRKESAV